ncbi:hypothetical protein LZF95_13005 [Algoriphagus sp. AGSA1]|uniref:hypothetical protein n=1 Tax=Algoriphagus sp. AGSA1 TaxID=2907213 RepID=UPI001F2C1497|nr:hypothetical protein [Algoriphagus sp. AGSA1]MCE7055600.1 hypothetical protein [Algoriphagus sp. AGSA1]
MLVRVFVPKAQQVAALNAAKRNSGLGNPNEYAKSANGTFGNLWINSADGDPNVFWENYESGVAMW